LGELLAPRSGLTEWVIAQVLKDCAATHSGAARHLAHQGRGGVSLDLAVPMAMVAP
jgi:hypothetical protein